MNLKHTTVAAALLLVSVCAQNATTTLDATLRQAFTKGATLASSANDLAQAKADLVAKEADPSTLIVPLTQAKQNLELAKANLQNDKLVVTQNVVAAYLNLFEGQENIKLLEAQVALDTRNLEVAKAKLAAKNGTQLDVSKAENTLNGDRQNLSDAKNNLPILSNKLEAFLGQSLAGNVVASKVAIKEIKIDLAALENKLEDRVPNVLRANQAVELAALNVKLSDNDYTAPATLRDAKSTLENNQRALDTAKKNALTNLRDAHRNLQASLEKLRVALKDQDNAEESLRQDQIKLKNGTISKLQLQQTEVALLRANQSQLQSENTYLRALVAVGSNAGTDTTGLVARAENGG